MHEIVKIVNNLCRNKLNCFKYKNKSCLKFMKNNLRKSSYLGNGKVKINKNFCINKYNLLKILIKK